MAETTVRAASGTVPVSSPSPGTVERWLASAHPSPGIAFREWGSVAKLALIPLGRRFEAVRIPQDVVQRASGSGTRPVTPAWLAHYLNSGPVIHDPGFRRYYALVPPGTARTWCAPVAECLGGGTYLGVPRADRIGLDEHARASYWAVPMLRPGRLCVAADVLALAMAGGCLGDEDES
ncbi:hypothetical protein [Streptomyces massasporeus]|uniref:hypothetical protein n=1 Tax=Streptomyces massasporeus TaxID=67324 RepID=UPI0036FB9F71